MDLSKTIDAIAAQSTVKANSGDYKGADGLLYCGKCKTRKQHRINLPDGERVVYCLCKCEAAERDAETERQNKKMFDALVERNRQAAFSDPALREWTFERDDGKNPTLMTAMRRYADNFAELRGYGTGLILYGNVGGGKTYAACCVANALLDKGYRCTVSNMSRIVNQLQSTWDGRQDYIDRLATVDLLVIDDLAAERNTEYMNEQVFSVIDARYRSGRPLIVTTNLDGGALLNPATQEAQRVYSRIMERCYPIEVKGEDKRKANRRVNVAETKKILGI